MSLCGDLLLELSVLRFKFENVGSFSLNFCALFNELALSELLLLLADRDLLDSIS